MYRRILIDRALLALDLPESRLIDIRDALLKDRELTADGVRARIEVLKEQESN